jgi:hypothetical protein
MENPSGDKSEKDMTGRLVAAITRQRNVGYTFLKSPTICSVRSVSFE